MADFHRLTVLGRVVGDPTVREVPNGGRVATFGLPINFTRRKKNAATGQWEGDGFIINVDCWNRERGQQLADIVSQYVKKGRTLYVEGRLRPNEYTDRNGKQIFRPVLVADVIQFVDYGQDGGPGGVGSPGEEGMPAPSAAPRRPNAAPQKPSSSYSAPPQYDDPGPDVGGGGDDIPF